MSSSELHAVLHVKDSYFFEVPTSIWQPKYATMDAVPKFLRDAHPEVVEVKEFEEAMAGKILIPQPFGKLKNLYEAETGFCLSKFMIIEAFVALILVVLFTWLTKMVYQTNKPRGRLRNALEALVQVVRDQIARPAIGHDADKYVPFLMTAFFFILVSNLVGMLPFSGTITGDIHVTAGLALCTFCVGLYFGVQNMGYGGFILNFVPPMELPALMSPLKYGIFLIELFGHLIKHAVLSIRLFANMVAGHIVIASVILLITKQSGVIWYLATGMGIVGLALFSLLELLVAFLQAYVFTMLSAIFIGASVHSHGGDHAHAEHH